MAEASFLTSGLVSPANSGDSTTNNVAQQVTFLWLPYMDDCRPNAVYVRVLKTRQVVAVDCCCRFSLVIVGLGAAHRPVRRGEKQQRTGERQKGYCRTSLPPTRQSSLPFLAVAHDTSLFYRSAHCDHSPDNRVEPLWIAVAVGTQHSIVCPAGMETAVQGHEARVAQV
jgi:hypothetical protein